MNTAAGDPGAAGFSAVGAAVPLALLVDGDNIAAARAGQIIRRALAYGALRVRRVYGDLARLPGWSAAPGFRHIHTGAGKNATDMLMVIDAMDLALGGTVGGVVIASSDRDFTHLAFHLVERGFPVIGIGEATTPEVFRRACSCFELLAPAGQPEQTPPTAPAPVQMTAPPRTAGAAMRTSLEIVSQHGKDGRIRLTQLGALLGQRGLRCSDAGSTTWRSFLTAHPDRFVCDPKGPEARVRLR
jgi:uncharacterized LabA/DUF88 family protein